jgi:hypothetical protein
MLAGFGAFQAKQVILFFKASFSGLLSSPEKKNHLQMSKKIHKFNQNKIVLKCFILKKITHVNDLCKPYQF